MPAHRLSWTLARILAPALAFAAVGCTSGGERAWRSSVAATPGADAPSGLAASVAPNPVGPLSGGATIVVTAAGSAGAGWSPQIFVDADGNRETGMWTFQSALSASGWDLLIDGDGDLYRHEGPSNRWTWRPVDRSAHRYTTLENRREVVLPAWLVTAGPLSVRVAVEAGGDWYPAAFLPGVGIGSDAGPPLRRTGPPQSLAIFYGRAPWLVRGCQPSEPVVCSASAFAAFDHVVLASGLEDPAHPSHSRSLALVAELRMMAPETEVWGYVSLVGGPATGGSSRSVYTVQDIARRAAGWKALGATGVFLDEADLCRPAFDDCPKDPSGREVEVSRARQAAAAAVIHHLGMPVFVNGYAVPQLLGEVNGVPAPFGGAQAGRPADMYLLENLTVSAGRRASGFDAQVGHARLQLALRLGAAAGVRMAAVDTVSEAAPDLSAGPRFYREGLELASQVGLDAYGYTNSSYSSEFAVSTNLALPPAAAIDRRARPPDPLAIEQKVELRD